MRRHALASISAAAALVAGDASTRADSKADIPANARAAAARGQARHNAGDYAGAIAAFNEAYALAPSPALLFNLAQSYRLAGNCEDAATMYKRFLDANPPREARSLAEVQLMAVEQCREALRPVELPPPLLLTGITPAVAIQPAVIEDDDSERHALHMRDASIGLAAGGGVALVGALVFELRAHDESQLVGSAYAHGGSYAGVASEDAAGRHDALLADAFAATGVVALAASAAFYELGGKDAHASVFARRHLAMSATPHSASVHASWRF